MEQWAEIPRNLMEEKGMKVSDIVRISVLPYSIVKSILDRGSKRPVMLMCAKYAVPWDKCC